MSPAGLRHEWRADCRVAAPLAKCRAAMRGTGPLRAPDGGPLDCQSSGAAPTQRPKATCAVMPSASEPASRPTEALASALGVSRAPPCSWLRIAVRAPNPIPSCRRATSYLLHRSGTLAWLSRPPTDLTERLRRLITTLHDPRSSGVILTCARDRPDPRHVPPESGTPAS